MVNFFVRENPLLNFPHDDDDSEPQDYVPNNTPVADAPTMLDYGEFGFPDEQVVKEWTIIGCLTTVVCVGGLLFGLIVLVITGWKMYAEQHRPKNPALAGTVQIQNQGKGLKRDEVKAYTVDCKWNYPSAMTITPDGKYFVTAGGPRTRAEDSERRVMPREKADSAPEWNDMDDFEDRAFAEAQDVRLLSYDSRPADLPSGVYVDYLNLGKNGKRISDHLSAKPQLDKDKSEDELDISYDEAFSGASLPTLAELEAEHHGDINDGGVWSKTRPSVESYPIAFWSMESMQPLVVYWNHEYPIVDIAVSPDGKKVVSADSGGNAILWSLDSLPGEDGVETPTWHFVNKMQPNMRTLQRMGKVHTIHAVTFTPSGRQFVLAATVDALDETGNSYTTCGALILWDIENWSEVLRKRGTGDLLSKVDTYYQTFQPVGKYCDVQYTPNGKYLIAAAAGSNAGIYYFDNRTNNPAYGTCMADLKSEEQRPRKGYTSEFKPNLVQGVSHHDFPNAESVVLAVSPDMTSESKEGDRKGLTIVSADNYGRIVFWDFAPRTNRPREGVKCIAYWSPKNSENTTRNVRHILYSMDQKMVMILGDEILIYKGKAPYDFLGALRTSVNEKSTMEKNEYYLVSGFFSQDNKYFLGGGDDCLVRMWHVEDIPINSRFMVDESTTKGGKAVTANEDSLAEIQKKFSEMTSNLTREEREEAEEEARTQRKEDEKLKTRVPADPDAGKMFKSTKE
ncbi:MAG: WD40 repeat domain-containing protein [Thermoguttaceae bacterium]|nr:WD40 repeat domain-containing protein [Thermoguttaceae bacterium]